LKGRSPRPAREGGSREKSMRKPPVFGTTSITGGEGGRVLTTDQQTSGRLFILSIKRMIQIPGRLGEPRGKKGKKEPHNRGRNKRRSRSTYAASYGRIRGNQGRIGPKCPDW